MVSEALSSRVADTPTMSVVPVCVERSVVVTVLVMVEHDAVFGMICS